LFAISVLFLNHAKIDPDRWDSQERRSGLDIPSGIETAQGREAIGRAQQILRQVGRDGEIGFTRYVKATRHFVFPVSKPGWERNVDVDLTARTAIVSERRTGALEAFAYLHKMPGPHNAAIRGNWRQTRLWRPFADVTVYLTLFITMTGLYLWWTLKAERTIGMTLLALGALTFSGLIYVVIR
jgi:hypothetical protein